MLEARSTPAALAKCLNFWQQRINLFCLPFCLSRDPCWWSLTEAVGKGEMFAEFQATKQDIGGGKQITNDICMYVYVCVYI